MAKKKINILFIIIFLISSSIIIYELITIATNNYLVKKEANKVEQQIEEYQNQISSTTFHNTNVLNNNSIGVIIFPNNQKVAIYNSPTNKNLKIGAGKIVNNSNLNGFGNNILLGHNDTSFKELKKIKLGNIITIKTLTNSINYKVTNIYITTSTDPNPYQNTSANQLTLITCYPFYQLTPTTKRYIVVATPLI